MIEHATEMLRSRARREGRKIVVANVAGTRRPYKIIEEPEQQLPRIRIPATTTTARKASPVARVTRSVKPASRKTSVMSAKPYMKRAREDDEDKAKEEPKSKRFRQAKEDARRVIKAIVKQDRRVVEEREEEKGKGKARATTLEDDERQATTVNSGAEDSYVDKDYTVDPVPEGVDTAGASSSHQPPVLPQSYVMPSIPNNTIAPVSPTPPPINAFPQDSQPRLPPYLIRDNRQRVNYANNVVIGLSGRYELPASFPVESAQVEPLVDSWFVDSIQERRAQMMDALASQNGGDRATSIAREMRVMVDFSRRRQQDAEVDLTVAMANLQRAQEALYMNRRETQLLDEYVGELLRSLGDEEFLQGDKEKHQKT